MNRRVGEDRGSKETDRCPLTVTEGVTPVYLNDTLIFTSSLDEH
jgi:hypothetical protein